VATGEHSTELARTGDEELPEGTVVTTSGRLSAARMVTDTVTPSPFTPVQLALLDEALTIASRTTGLHFSVYLGALQENTRAHADTLHALTVDPARAVLIAVSPGQRVVEVVTGAESARRLPDRSCRLAVMSMVASFKEGDLIGGLVSGLRMLSDQAGVAHH
jgi:uncharacterized protein DUF5130